MKLRYAVYSGMERASEDYDDLHYVGTIQVDTEHIHCHLAMVDMGIGNITEDGTQRGKISAATKIRYGMALIQRLVTPEKCISWHPVSGSIMPTGGLIMISLHTGI